jgi:hypothetical protein
MWVSLRELQHDRQRAGSISQSWPSQQKVCRVHPEKVANKFYSGKCTCFEEQKTQTLFQLAFAKAGGVDIKLIRCAKAIKIRKRFNNICILSLNQVVSTLKG